MASPKSSIIESALGLLGIDDATFDLSESDKKAVGKDLEDLIVFWNDVHHVETGYFIGGGGNLNISENSGLVPGSRLCVVYNLAKIAALRFGRELPQEALNFSLNCFEALKRQARAEIPRRSWIIPPRGVVESGIRFRS